MGMLDLYKFFTFSEIQIRNLIFSLCVSNVGSKKKIYTSLTQEETLLFGVPGIIMLAMIFLLVYLKRSNAAFCVNNSYR